MKGTPRPFASTVPTAALIIPGTAVGGSRKRDWQDEAELLKREQLL